MVGPPAVPDKPAVDQLTGTSFRLSAIGNSVNNGDGGSPIKDFNFGWGLSTAHIGNYLPTYTNLTTRQYVTVTAVQDANGNSQNVKPNTTYYAQLQIVNQAGYGTWSGYLSFKTPDYPDAPPMTASTSITDHSFNMQYDYPASDGNAAVDSYDLRYGTDSSGAGATIRTVDAGSGTQPITGLLAGTTYYTWVRAHNVVGYSPWSARITTKTVADPPSSPAPIGVDLVTQYSFHYRFSTTGVDGGSPITSYDVGYGTNATTPQTIVSTTTGDNTYVGLTRNTKYYVWVRAKNAVGTSAWSTVLSFTTLAYVPAVTTPKLLDTVTQISAHYTFSDPTDNGGAAIDGRQIGYGTDATTPQTIISSDGDDVVSNLIPGTQYYFWSRTHNMAGYSNWSAVKTATTTAGARISVAGVWYNAVPYVRTGGVWKIAQPYVKTSGVWKQTG